MSYNCINYPIVAAISSTKTSTSLPDSLPRGSYPQIDMLCSTHRLPTTVNIMHLFSDPQTNIYCPDMIRAHRYSLAVMG